MARFIGSQAFVVVLGISLSGCKSGPSQAELLDNVAKQPQSGASADGSSYSVFQSPTDYLTDGDQAKAPVTEVAQVTATGHVGKLKNAANSIKGAFQIEPTIVHAADPTRLKYNPGPIQPQLFLSAAALCEQQGQLAKAAEQYNRLLELDPKNRSALIGLGRLSHRTGDLDAAIGVYRTALQHHANDPVIYNDLGLCLARAGRIQESIATLHKAIQLQPESETYRNNMAAVLVEAHRTPEAVALLQQTCGADVAYYNVGYMLHQRGDAQAAAEHFAHALRINPSLTQARQMLNQMTPQIGTMPPRRVAPRRGLRTSMNVPNAQPIPTQPGQAPIVSKNAAGPSPVVQAAGFSSRIHAAPTIPASHVAPVANEEEELGTGIRMPLPRRTLPDQGTLLPPSPGEVPSPRAVNFLPVAE